MLIAGHTPPQLFAGRAPAFTSYGTPGTDVAAMKMWQSDKSGLSTVRTRGSVSPRRQRQAGKLLEILAEEFACLL